ncbi:protein kinase [Nonomuraea sp. NPDC055795]
MYGHWGVPGYTEVRELGAGASGRVVLATRDHDGEQVAIKYLSDELRADVTFVARFRHEARLLGTMRSPYNARLIDYVETGEGAAIIMDLVNGVSLREVLSSEGPTGPEAALTVLKGSLLGLSEAHAVGVVHRGVQHGHEELLEAFLEPYAELLERLATAGAQEVQLDEPAPAHPTDLRRLARVYRRLGELSNRPRLMVCLCSGEAGPALTVLGRSRVESIALDFVTAPGTLDALTRMGGLPRTTVVAAVVDGRSPHNRPVKTAAATCATISGLADRLVVAASCSPHQPAPLETAAAVVRVGLGHA